MSEQLRFGFSLDDGVSGPARRIKTGLEGLKSAFGDLGSSVKTTASGMKEAFDKIGEVSEKLFFSIEVVKKLAEPLVEIGEKIFDIGKEFTKATLESAEFAERSHIAFAAMLGSGKAADDVMKSIVQTASTLPITTQAAFGYATSLITGGFKGGDLKTLLTAVSDIGALNPANQEGAKEELVSHLRRIKGEGFLDERSLRSLAGIGINEGTLAANIGKYLSIPVDQVREAVAHRMVKVDVGIAAILDTIKSEEGGKIGNLSSELAETSGGLISTIKSRFFEATLGLSEGPGMKAFTGFLRNIRDLTDLTSASGQHLKSVIGDTFNAIFTSIFGRFNGETGKSGLIAFFDNVLDVAKELPETIHAVFDDIGDLLEGFFGGSLAKGWKDLFDPEAIRSLGPAFHDIGAALATAAGFARDIAASILPVAKLIGGAGAIVATGGAAGGETFLSGVKGIGGLVGKLFEDTAQGAGAAVNPFPTDDLPHHASGGITTGQHTAVVGEVPELITPLPPGGLSALGGGSKSVSVGEIHVHVGGESGGQSQQMKEDVRQGTLLALQQILESMNLEMGAGVA